MGKIEITREMCKGCGLCISVCVKKCIEFSDEINRYGVHPVRMKECAECTGCAMCAMMCPDTAIEVYREVKEVNT